MVRLVSSFILLQCGLLACVVQAKERALFRVEEESAAATMDLSAATISDSIDHNFLDEDIPSSQLIGVATHGAITVPKKKGRPPTVPKGKGPPPTVPKGKGPPPTVPKGKRPPPTVPKGKGPQDSGRFDKKVTPTAVSRRLNLGNRRLRQGHTITSHNATPMLDFLVAGFPKCGTTTLLKAFEKHAETAMASTEQCAVANARSDAVAMKNLDMTLQTLVNDASGSTNDMDNMKFSFKCPTAIFSHKSITRMQEHSPDAKFVIGVRHPILMLQSFYNYRVTEIHVRKLNEAIPSLEEVLSQNEPWKGVSLDATRYELFLMQLAKTTMTTSEIDYLMEHPGYDLAIKPNNLKIFFYDVEQLDDEDETRSAAFRERLSSFLGLTQPLAPFEHENINHFVGSAGFDETIDICSPRFDELRSHLVEQGDYTARWLIDEFIQSDDVVVANKDHLVAAIQSWNKDPCLKEDEASMIA